MTGLLGRLWTALDQSGVSGALASLLPGVVRRSFLAKFLVALLVVVLLGSAVGAVFFVDISTALDRQVSTEARATTQMHSTIYSNWLESRQQRLTSIAGIDYMSGGSLDRAARRLSLEAARSGIYLDMHLLALDTGEVLASSNESAASRTYYQLGVNETLIRTGSAFVHPGQYETFAGQSVVGLIVRLPAANRVLVAEVNPDAGPSPPQTVAGAQTFVVTEDGQRVFGATDVPQPADVTTTVGTTRTDGALLSYRLLPNSELVVVRRTPTNTAFAVKDAVLFSFAATLVLVFGILVAVGFVGGRAAATDLRRLVEKANAIAGGDLAVDFATNRRDEIGQLYAAFAEMRDALGARITEAEAAREDAQAAKAEIEEQKAIVSVLNRILRHNLRNDLVVINGHNDVLQDLLGEDVEHTTKIESRTTDLLDKAEKAREIERLVTGETEQLTAIDAVAIVEAEVERFQREFPEADIAATMPARVSVRAHDALSFVVSNLVENAIEHNDSPKPTVEIEVAETEGRVEIEIADDGPGIPDTELDSLEEGYETATQHGSGLGLWLVNWLVDAMDGELSFERRDPTGTVVTVQLESADDSPSQPTQAEAGS